MNDSILNRARQYLEDGLDDEMQIVEGMVLAYDELEEKYLELIYTPTGIACDERHAHALKTLEQAND